MNDEIIKKIKKAYLKGKKYKEICKEYNISINQLKGLINKYKWKRKSNKSETMKGNKNGKGAPLNNKRALITGEFEKIYKDILDDDEADIYETFEIKSERNLLIDSYKILIIRERRILKRLKSIEKNTQEMTIDTITKINGNSRSETLTAVVSKDEKVIKFHNALDNIEKQKIKIIEKLMSLPAEDDNKSKHTTPILEDINRQLKEVFKNGKNN